MRCGRSPLVFSNHPWANTLSWVLALPVLFGLWLLTFGILAILIASDVIKSGWSRLFAMLKRRLERSPSKTPKSCLPQSEQSPSGEPRQLKSSGAWMDRYPLIVLAVLLIPGCGTTSILCSVEKPPIPANLKEPCPIVPPLQAGTFPEITAALVVTAGVLNECRERHRALVDAVRAREGDYDAR